MVEKMDKNKLKIYLNFLKKYIKNILFYPKNYKKFLNVYEDEISKKYVKEYILNNLIYPLYHFKILNSEDYYEEISTTKKLMEFKENNEFVIKDLKFKFLYPPSWIVKKHKLILPEVFLYHCALKNFEKDILNKIRNGNIIDCGAFIGDSSTILSGYTNYKVYAFEPDESIFNYLVENINNNNLANKVTPINYGTGDREEILNFGDVELKITTIDNIVEKEKINGVSLIKMDIEGYELRALKGARKTIKKYKPVLIISAYHKREDLLEIPYYLKDLIPEYRFRFLRLRKHPIYERVIMAYPQINE
ncbi:FkbM family methyltransferase [Methanothermococcus sp. SCGC AD-155-K20]|nr:FkbM family methyltransferase [Methanothermococcus sp. SCGC AD-155-K20]